MAKINIDPRTLNKSVFGYSEIWTQNDVFNLLERITGEAVPREHVCATAYSIRFLWFYL